MPENLVLFWGWNRNEKSYQGLIDSAPEGWNIYHISYHELIKDSKLVVLPGQGHDWILHSPKLFWQNIV